MNKTRINLGSNWADPERCGLTVDELEKAHDVLDVKYLREVNRTLVRTMHDAVFSGGLETIATTRLRSILKTPQVAKIIAGEVVGGENLWCTQPWLMESTQMWAKLIYRFESMTEMINGAFMDDLGELLSSVTGNQRKTLYEIDQEFEKMCEMLLKNFATIKSLMPFLRSSLRQTMIRKLSKVGKDKEAWKKAEEYLTQLQDDEHMLTLEDTDVAINRAEQYLHRCDGAGAAVKDKVAFKADVGDAEAPDAKFAAMEKKIQALQAQLRGDAAGAKRGRNGVPVQKKPVPVCLKEKGGCGKRGHTVEDCWEDLDAAKAKIDAAMAKRDKKRGEIEKRKPSAKEARAYIAACNKASAAGEAAEESDYSRSCVSLHGSRFEPPPSTYVALQAMLDQEFVPNTPGAVLDSAGMLNILQGDPLGSGTRVKLTGITGDSTEAEIADAVFPVITTDGKRYLIRIQGQNIIAKKATNCIMSLAVLMKAGYDVKFRVGTAEDAKDGGILHTPDGKKIALKFEDNMWRLPMWSKPIRQQHKTGAGGFPVHVNKFSALPCHGEDMIPTSVQEAHDMAYPGDIVDFVVQQTKVDFATASATLDAYHGDVVDTIVALTCGADAAVARDDDIIQAKVSSCDVSPVDLSVAEQVRLCHDRDGHPSKNKHREIFQARKGRGYPPNFLALLDHFKCETCAVTSGARKYRQSERVKTKGYHKSDKMTVKPPDAQSAKATGTHPPPCASCTLTYPCCTDVGTDGAAQLAQCFTHAVHSIQQADRSDKTSKSSEQEATGAPRLIQAPKHRMHIDFANSITLGRMKERYYLIIVVDSIDFTWAQTSTTRSEPEDLLHEFITMTGIRISSIRMDGAGEFRKSTSFTAYCKLHDITIEEVPAYTHTFNARAEGAIRICKEKVRALLRRANMPRRFWPDALLHWLRTYAHWPDKAGHTAWEKLDELGSHALCHDLERDRHVFGSYVTGHLPREHPHVADTTHDDRAEEGVYLGNDLTTPTFWLWSFRHRKAMRLSDPKHFDHILPFLQPADVHHSIPLNSDDIKRMHATDDAATLDAGEHDIRTNTVGEASDTGEHAAKSIADATRAHSARMHAARVRDAGECDAALAVDMPRITRTRTHSVEASSFTDSGEQVQVQERESAKAPSQHLSLKDHK